MKKIVKIDPIIKHKNVADILELPVVIRVNEFKDADAKDFSEQISKAHNTGQPVIPVIIDSYGGQVYSLLSMIAEIKASQIPVATICTGKAMSCGAILLTCGQEGLRFIDKNATVMLHDVSSMALGKNEEIKASAKQTDKLQKQIFTLLAENCNKKPNYFLDLIHSKSHAEWYLNAQEAKKHNIVNHIRIPHFKINVSVDITLE